MQVITRDDRIVDFQFQRIFNALDKAFKDVEGVPCPESMKEAVERHFDEKYDLDHVFDIEEIQNIVENLLMEEQHFEVARGYILYRNRHAEDRMIRERIEYMDEYGRSNTNASTASETDPNANVTIKNIANLNGEVWKSKNRKIQRYRMRKKLKELYPQWEQQYEKDLRHRIIYAHDEASYPVVTYYCKAVTMWPFLLKGSSGMDGLGSSEPHNLKSFCGQFGNLVFLLSAQCKGAVAYGEFFNVLDYYAAKDWGDDYINCMEEVIELKPQRTMRQVLHQYFQQIVYTINQPAGNRCYQSPFTNFSYYDHNYWKAVFEDFIFPDGRKPVWERISFLQKEFMQWLNKERTRTLLTFPVETMALLSDGKDIVDKEYKEFTAKMYAQGHSFFTYISENPNSLASCCRLRNEIQENVFTFTNGLTGVQTGSANVITLNMSRITQDWARANEYSRTWLANHFFDEEVQQSYKKYLEEILERVYAYQITYKTMLYEVEEQGLLTASNTGYISMRKLYSTIGINGMNEAAEFVGLRCNYNKPYMNFCRLITGTISTQNRAHSKDPRFQFNCEFVPAEGLSSKNYNWDKEDGYWVPDDRVLYNSYFYLADDPTTNVLEKFKLHGREFTELLDGGVGLHCNLSEHLSEKQYEKLLEIAVKNGTSYFTFNVPNSECTNEECHHIVKAPLDVCPKCGARMRQWTRVIGYLRPVESFDRYRYIEAGRRYYASELK